MANNLHRLACVQSVCSLTISVERASTCTFRAVNSSWRFAITPISDVLTCISNRSMRACHHICSILLSHDSDVGVGSGERTGEKSLGYVTRIAQQLFTTELSSISPCVDGAVNFGTSSPKASMDQVDKEKEREGREDKVGKETKAKEREDKTTMGIAGLCSTDTTGMAVWNCSAQF